MDTDIVIDPEFNDDDEFERKLDSLNSDEDNSDQIAPKPQVDNDITPDVLASPDAVPYVIGSGAASKQTKKEVDKALKDAERRHRKEQQEALRQAREEHRRQLREDREAAKRLQQESKEANQVIRAEAIGSRVNAYSLASALGFPGYTMASAADTMYIRPEEERKLQEQKEYQKELANYLDMLKEQRERELVAREQEIENRPVEAIVLDKNTGKPIPPNQIVPSSSNQWSPRPDKQNNQQPALPTTIPQTNDISSVPPPNDNQSPEPPTNVTYSPRPSPTSSSQQVVVLPNQTTPPTTPPTQVPTPPGNQQPPIPPGQPPVPPTPPNNQPPPPGIPPNVAQFPPVPTPSPIAGSPAQLIQAAIQIGQTINKEITDAFQTVSNISTSAIRGDGTSATKSAIGIGQKVTDPLGVNIPLNVAVQGFNTLLDTNQAILESIKENIAFAPQTLEATIEGDIKKLMQSIEAAQRLDPITAQLVEANNRFDMAWVEFKNEIILKYGPEIAGALNIIIHFIRGATISMEAAPSVLGSWAKVISDLLRTIGQNTSPKDQLAGLDEALFKELEDFFKPNTMPADHKKVIDPLRRLQVP